MSLTSMLLFLQSTFTTLLKQAYHELALIPTQTDTPLHYIQQEGFPLEKVAGQAQKAECTPAVLKDL